MAVPISVYSGRMNAARILFFLIKSISKYLMHST